GATSGPVTVTTPDGESNAVDFTVTPAIDGLDPILGPVGTQVTVTGTTFGDTQGTSYVEVGGTRAADYTSWADGEIVVSVPPGATSGPVTVTTPDGESNAVDFTVTHSTWYFAEGCTTGGFETWILVENPDPHAVKVYISFYTPEGLFAPAALQGVEVAAETRVTFNAGAYIQDTHLSTVVSSEGGQVFCERSMYGGDRTWGHNSIGVTFPASTWYLAEGCTEGGMETWILVQNPGAEPVEVELEFQTEKGKVPGPSESLPGHTRRSFNAAEYVQSYDVSTLVTASGGVVCERSMYGGNRTWGHNSIGTPMTSQTWYLAEGCAEAGMETWILVQNPGDEEVAVDLTLHTEEGEVEGPTGVIPPRSRQSFLVNEFVTSFHVSTLVTASGGVVCERSMYGGGRTWAHNSIGITAPDNAWHLVEGCTEGGMETWVLVQNPGDDEVQVQLTFRTGAGETQGPEVAVPARSRYTFNVGEFVQAYDVATLVTASGGVVCERSMYGGGRTWAHNSIGFAP
ncbi:MAG: IPT/TIG domain-containing protein, partial [Actinobacteria bacterium]|nr:IPT/TIG domain-containing protein [Actinomycetota bacterium]